MTEYTHGLIPLSWLCHSQVAEDKNEDNVRIEWITSRSVKVHETIITCNIFESSSHDCQKQKKQSNSKKAINNGRS